MISQQANRRGRWVRGVLVLAVLAGVSLGLSQCRTVTDPVVELNRGIASPLDARHKECTLLCDAKHRVEKAAELALHKAVIRACGNDLECRRFEHDRYRDAKKAIEGRKKACKFLCRYSEGGVSGGK